MTKLMRVKKVLKKGLKFFSRKKKAETPEKTDPKFHQMLAISSSSRKKRKYDKPLPIPRRRGLKPTF